MPEAPKTYWERSLNKRAICLVERGAGIYCTTGSQRSLLKWQIISPGLYVAPWNWSKGQLKTLMINFTANEKPLYSTKLASLLNLFPWWNWQKVHPNIIAFDVRRTQHIILGFLWYSQVTFSASVFRRMSALAGVIYVISNCHMAITCITGSIKVNKMITREYLSSAKEWTLELFSKQSFITELKARHTIEDQVTFVLWEVYPWVWVYLHICSLTSYMHKTYSEIK